MKQAKIDEELNNWLVFLQAKAEAEGDKIPSHNELLKDGILCRYPRIRQASDEYQRHVQKLSKVAKDADPGDANGKTPHPDVD